MNGLKLLVLPGWANSGPGHWQTFWEKSLPNSRRVLQDNWREPHKQAWVKRLNEEISKEQEPLVLVCHSLGCWLAAHWAIEHPDLAKTKVRFALLVAPPDLARTNDELWAGMKVFAVSLFKKKKLSRPLVQTWLPFPNAKLPFPSRLVYSSNDLYCSVEVAKKIGTVLGSDFVCLQNAGHINSESGLGEWEEGKKLLKF
jgi:predicted alpha/beta hydrolase family esterase